jgi:hypothetical protein
MRRWSVRAACPSVSARLAVWTAVTLTMSCRGPWCIAGRPAASRHGRPAWKICQQMAVHCCRADGRDCRARTVAAGLPGDQPPDPARAAFGRQRSSRPLLLGGRPGGQNSVLASSKGLAAPGHGRSQHQPSRIWLTRERQPGPPLSHIRARRPADRPGGHDRQSTRPAAWHAPPARDRPPGGARGHHP